MAFEAGWKHKDNREGHGRSLSNSFADDFFSLGQFPRCPHTHTIMVYSLIGAGRGVAL